MKPSQSYNHCDKDKSVAMTDEFSTLGIRARTFEINQHIQRFQDALDAQK
jgi:hypothetical protein